MNGPRLTRLSLRGYRSIDGWQHIDFPSGEPLVLLGENNAGKSNVLRAIAFLFGDFWPGNHQPEDHEYFGRQADGNEISMVATVDDLPCNNCGEMVDEIRWRYDPDDEKVSGFSRQGRACSHTWMNNSIRQSLYCMSIGVNRDLSYQLSYGSKWTTLSKLMRRFHDRLVADPKRVERLKVIFTSLVDTFHEVDEFQSFGDALRDSFADFGGNLQYGLGVDFSAYDPSNFFRSLRVFPHVAGQPRTYEELGTGQEQVLAMAFAYAYGQAFGGDGLILAIEEPESHLHPLAQRWLARKLKDLAAVGIQVVLTTHSPYFVDLAKPWTMVLLRKNDESAGTVATQHSAEALVGRLVELGAPADVVSTENVGSYYESAATYHTLAGFFGRACVLVEGPTEQMALPELLERCGLDLLQEGVALIPVEGITNMAKWARLFTCYGLEVYAIFDTDTDKADRATASLTCANEVLAALGVSGGRQHAPGSLATFQRYACFDPNYEVALRNTFGAAYTALEAKAAEQVGRSKQLRARFCATRIANPEGWKPLTDLASYLSALVPAPPPAPAVEAAPPVAPTSAVSREAPRRPR